MADSAAEKTKLQVVAALAVEKRIFVVRERQVMFDEDLADLYGVGTKRLVEQVKRNLERFPEDFMFQLSKDEAGAFEVADCDLKRRPRWASLCPIRIYGAGRSDAFIRLAE